MQFKLSILTRSVLAAALCSGAVVYHASANNQDRLLMLAQAASTSSAVQGTAVAPVTKKKKTIGKSKTIDNSVGGTKAGGNKAVALSSSDCFAVGGKVITVTDNRCPSNQYCRLPDTNAVCIDKAKVQ